MHSLDLWLRHSAGVGGWEHAATAGTEETMQSPLNQRLAAGLGGQIKTVGKKRSTSRSLIKGKVFFFLIKPLKSF